MSDQETTTPAPGVDPRPRPGRADVDGLRPAVAGPARSGGLVLIIGVPVVLGVVVLLWLNARRSTDAPAPREAAAASADIAAPAAPADLLSFQEASRAGAAQPIAGPQPLSQPATARPPIAPAAPPIARTPDELAFDAGLKAPAMVVDLAEATPPPAAKAAAQSGGATLANPGGPAAGPSANGLNGDEQFARRVGAAEPERAEATVMHNLSQTVAQGTIIAGVLETALDSDLPGYARAVVSREVRGFDNSTILIPQGSRIIGQYKSAVAQGQSRAFVIWTRVIRPDGATIQIGSPGTDPLGRAGLAGSVNRHFIEEFSGAILLSVINAGLTSLAGTPSTEVVIGSAQQATNLAGSALLPTNIPPTIRVPQGAPIRIFVARDLDFSPAGAVGH